jgi:hypothetical protein
MELEKVVCIIRGGEVTKKTGSISAEEWIKMDPAHFDFVPVLF